MKRELKHFYGYLPYGVKAKLSKEGKFNLDNEYPNEYCNDICTITDFTTYSKDLGGSMKVDKTKDYTFDFDSLSEIEIILHPLSDLRKEEFNYLHTLLRVHIGKNRRDKLINEGYGITDLPYFIFEQLLENHFDLFNLIKNESAIDINTL